MFIVVVAIVVLFGAGWKEKHVTGRNVQQNDKHTGSEQTDTGLRWYEKVQNKDKKKRNKQNKLEWYK